MWYVMIKEAVKFLQHGNLRTDGTALEVNSIRIASGNDIKFL